MTASQSAAPHSQRLLRRASRPDSVSGNLSVLYPARNPQRRRARDVPPLAAPPAIDPLEEKGLLAPEGANRALGALPRGVRPLAARLSRHPARPLREPLRLLAH